MMSWQLENTHGLEGTHKPVAIIGEGVFEYLTPEEQGIARDNIAYFLKNYSPEGAWITPDFSYHVGNWSKGFKIMHWLSSKQTGRVQTFFGSHDQVQGFLNDGGLNGELLPNDHLTNKLTCIEKGLDPRRVPGLMAQYQAYIIRLDHSA